MNDCLEVKVKRLHPKAKIPTRAHPTDSGFDMYAMAPYTIPARGHLKIALGVAFELPENHEMQIRGRSGMAGKGIVAHHGTVDQNFRGQIAVHLYNHTDNEYLVNEGDRVCQVVIKRVPNIVLVEAEELSATDRGVNGFGSTGR